MRQSFIIIVCLTLFWAEPLNAQFEVDRDRLLIEFQSPEDSIKMHASFGLFSLYLRNDLEKSAQYLEEGQALAQKINHLQGQIKGLVCQGQLLENRGMRKEALDIYDKALDKAKNHPAMLQTIHSNIAVSHFYMSNYPKALAHTMKNLEYCRVNKDLMSEANALNTLGAIYFVNNQIPEAIQSFRQSKTIYVKENSGRKLIADIDFNMGELFITNGQLDSAEVYLLAARKAYQAESSAKGFINTGIGLAEISLKKNDVHNAMKLALSAVMVADSINDIPFKANALFAAGKIYCESGEFSLGIVWLKEALAMNLEMKTGETTISVLTALAEFTEKAGNLTESIHYHKALHQLKDSLRNSEKDKTFADMLVQYGTQRTTDSLNLARQQAQLSAAESEQSRIAKERTQMVMFISFGALAISLVMISLVIRSNQSRKRANNLLLIQNKEILAKNIIIEEKNKDITDSIRYASRIQQSILPSDDKLTRILGNYMLFFAPRDIVSGDFYWAEEKGEMCWFAVADCTGHGVPGAFMSLLGAQALNKVILEADGIPNPGAALDQVNNLIENALEKSLHGTDLKDGMDISLCAFNKKTFTLNYAGANNPLWIIRKNTDGKTELGGMPELEGVTELVEAKPDKQPIGRFAWRKPFTNNTMQLKPGDTLYLFSDGYADQFGEVTGKKLKIGALKQLLLSKSIEPIVQQGETLATYFENWKGRLEQIDDVCVIGVRV